MDMATRVPFFCNATSLNQCHKYCGLSPSLPLPISSSSLRLRSLSLSSSSSLGVFSLAKKRNEEGVKRVTREFGVVAMAESAKSTVLVTGAGGRTGKVFLVCALMVFFSELLFFLLV